LLRLASGEHSIFAIEASLLAEWDMNIKTEFLYILPLPFNLLINSFSDFEICPDLPAIKRVCCVGIMVQLKPLLKQLFNLLFPSFIFTFLRPCLQH
jgi:hypothetical protein